LSLAEYRELQEYAKAQGVTIVPEFDMPGHTNAALHAIPELNENGIAAAAYDGVDVGFSALRLANPATKPFIEAVFNTICDATIGDWVHIGGDEVHTVGSEEYVALVQIANDAVKAKGKRAIGWQEIANLVDAVDTTDKATLPRVQYWVPKLDSANVLKAAAAGFEIILSPADRVYLDMKHDEDDPVGQTWMRIVDLPHSRNWEPTEYLPELPASQIAGVEAALWSETCKSFEDLLSLIFPRLAAVAEVAWSQPGHEATFIQRLTPHDQQWRNWGVPERSIARLAATNEPQ